MKFSIRDLLWSFVVVGLATGWLITLFAKAPKTSYVRGHVGALDGKPFEGRIWLRSEDGRLLSALVRKGDFVLGHCPQGIYEVVFEGDEEALKYLNGERIFEISGWGGETHLGFGDVNSSETLPYQPEERRNKDWNGPPN